MLIEPITVAGIVLSTLKCSILILLMQGKRRLSYSSIKSCSDQDGAHKVDMELKTKRQQNSRAKLSPGVYLHEYKNRAKYSKLSISNYNIFLLFNTF